MFRCRRQDFLFLFLLFFTSAYLTRAYGQISPADYSNIGKYIHYYEDKSAVLDFEQASSPAFAKRYQPGRQEILNFGNSKSAIWIRFRFRYQGKQPLYVVLDAPNIETIDGYFPMPDGGFKRVQSGSLVRNTEGVQVENRYVFDLPVLPEGQLATVYMRLKTNNIMLVPVKLASADTILNHKPYKTRIEYAYMGVLVALLLFNLFLYTSLKDKTYLYYTLYVLTLSLYLLVYIRGYGFLFGDDIRIYMSKHPHLFLSLSVVTSLAFCRRFLSLDKTVPSMLKLYYALGMCGVVLFFTSLLGFKSISTSIAQVLTISVSLTAWISGVIAYRRGHRPAKYYVVAWSFIWVSVAIVTASLAGIIATNEFTMQLVPVASTAELLMLSFALGDRYKIIIQSEQRAREENLQLIQSQNLVLEQKVTERTRQLNQLFSIIAHDLRSPLNSLMSILELNRMDALDGEELSALLEQNKDNIGKINNTLNNLLHWARQRMEGQVSEPVNFNLKEVIDELMPAYLPLAQKKNISLSYNIAAMLRVYADKDEINLVIRNLIDNAIKFTPRGGNILIEMKLKSGIAEIGIENTVSADTSFGHVLSSGNRIGKVTSGTDNEGGVGLGLQLCRDYLAGNQSELGFSFENGRVRFFFTLPLAKIAGGS
ncbi:sensor histidine kinase [Pedobacter sp. JY14-1]|uniref:sensor histidine kinase n=1 Tax=Pedobacter sp. JY14-1 TaxID=3034151 RepID=UPI0023E32F0D|nr:sensor histidine kinase [Pedobacter sp. JY14-1]